MREPDIPDWLERKMFAAHTLDMEIARRSGAPYCFICEQRFKSAEAIEQHNKAKHGDE